MPSPTAPVLVRRAEPARRPRIWDAAGQRALAHRDGLLRLLGGPGTGKSTLIAQLAADRIRNQGVSPENVLVLTASRRAAAWMRTEITRLLTDRSEELRTAPEPLVRTVHSYAFAVLRLQAVRDQLPSPQLLNGPDQDALVRDLLAGDVETGARDWPETLRPALTVPGFAEELRDLLLRAAERGVGPERLVALGRRHDRPEWIAAGRFARQYEQVTLLRGAGGAQAPALDAAELVGSALLAFDTDPRLLAAEQERVRYVFVDDAQHLDPQQYWLVRRLGDTATEFVLAGDPDQAVYSFRGADPRCLLDADPDGANTEVLTVDHRMSKAIREAVQRLAARLPGSGPQRELVEPENGRRGSVQVRLLATEAQEAAWVADQLRRAHLLDEVAWPDMAVVVRSTGLSLPVLRRALLAAGVPIALPVDDLPLAQRNAVRPLLTLLRCAARPQALDADAAAELLASPLGGADPLALRRLRRGLRRLELAAGGSRASGELLVEVLRDDDRLAALEDSAAEPARRLARLLRGAADSVAAGHTVEETLWRVWKASGLEKRWVAQAERHDVAGAQADRDLDAVVSLFDAAAQYVDRLPGADVAGFADYLTSQQIAGSSLAPTAPRDNAVSVLTAHAASGQEWEVVAIPGVQEGVWPDLRLRGSLLGVERLVDVLSGVDAERVSATAPLLAEERRLLLVAASRARRSLLVSAVRGEDEQPSRFLDELEGVVSDPDALERPIARPERGLTLADLVGELRRVVCDAETEPRRRERAAAQLARLAAAGVPGASPDTWYGLPESSSSAPLVTGDDPVRVSPSTVDILAKCPLRWLIERHGGQDTAELASVTGTLVHALVQAAADGADTAQLHKALDDAWKSVDAGAPWFSRKERKRVEHMLDAFLAWLVQSRAELTQIGVEKDLDVTVPGRPGGPWLRLRGRVDRLEADADGRPVVVDVKTGKTPVSKGDAEEHPQLAVYQLAAALGAFGDGDEPGGARLLYVAKSDRSGAATERAQQALDAERIEVWLDVVHTAAASSLGPAYVASENTDCPRCPARICCPVHPTGRQVAQ
ncbi:ATP-dependent helicase [Saccharopolyspora phatthalungensis]|uniref:DNA 3'-5' helicase n=1 Tax=Saccharopolyspora phatthalungensis TaxID=664693 RepID=A0A840Q046_9PSEU|nr:ATP-dependent DNA helicase [Saccharopolyspora phatthalungensis]MBB5153367.1 superfamily I DNA/RNA helicase/RecB family exonuclease [Saccharopolyspora phatthalungensis]